MSAAEPFFSIVVVTHNRPHLVVQTLKTLAAQTFDDFEVILIDNASEIPVEPQAREVLHGRVRHYRRETWIDPGDCWQFALSKLRGRYALFFADDDGLVPSALARVHAVITETGTPLLTVNMADYVHPEGRQIEGLGGNQLRFRAGIGSGALLQYDALAVAEDYFAAWGIGQRRRGKGLPASHSSAFFVNTALIRQVEKESGFYFVKPFADVGGLGAILRVKTVFFLDQPLVLIGMAARRALDGRLSGHRHLWHDFNFKLKYVPFQGHSFINLGVESHLQVALANLTLLDDYSLELQPFYYLRHLQEVAADRPWTGQTIRDLGEWASVVVRLPHAKRKKVIALLYDHLKPRVLRIFRVRSRIRQIKNRLVGQSKPAPPLPPPSSEWIRGEDEGFTDLVSCAEWLDRKLPPMQGSGS
jgi:glycosyltransferase involved in cell wall biosynthesis